MSRIGDANEKLRRLLRGYCDIPLLAATLGCCYNTAAKRMEHPELLSVADLQLICKRLGIPAEDLRCAIQFN